MIRPEVAELFDGLVRLFEDIHAIVIEGQGADPSPDMARVLAGHVRDGLSLAGLLLAGIEEGLS